MYSFIKKAIPITLASLTIITLCIKPLKAQNGASSGIASGVAASVPSGALDTAGGGAAGGGDYLKIIAINTTKILADVNQLPNYIQQGTAYFLAWMSPDKSTTTSNLQGSFTQLTNDETQNKSAKDSIMPQLTQDFFGTATQKTLPYGNDINYQTLKGLLFFNPDQRTDSDGNPVDPAMNYIENASSILVSHPIFQSSWAGTATNKQKYLVYFDAIQAVQSYNAQVLSSLYANSKNKDAYTKDQEALIQQITSGDWFQAVGSQSIGIVLRQILMFQSQMYVLLSRLLDTEKQLLTTQAMTNTLLVLLNQQSEELLYNKAIGKMQ